MPHDDLGHAPSVIDGHARLPSGDGPDGLLRAMDRHGVERALVSAGSVIGIAELARNLATGSSSTADPDNAAVLAAHRRHPDRITPFWFANPHRDPSAYRDADPAFAGVEISPAVHGIDLVDPRLDDWIDCAQSLGHPVYAVCLPRPGSTVADLVARALARPSVTFILGHAGVSPMDVTAAETVASVDNIVLETSCAFVVVIARAIELLGADRVLFGSEFPHQHPGPELAKIDALDLDPADHAAVCGGTSRRILARRSLLEDTHS